MNPLRGGPPEEIRLADPPLHRVLATINFSPVMKISDPTGVAIAGFQDKIRGEYPSIVQEQEQGVQIQFDDRGQMSAPMVISQPVWRFHSKAQDWRVSLTRETLSVETQTAYTYRDDFVGRLGRLLAAIKSEFAPAQCIRIGCRYLNVIEDARSEDLASLLRPEFLGFGGVPFGQDLEVSDCRAHFNVAEGSLLVRWGNLPPNVVHDQNVMLPADRHRWFLDLDAFDSRPADFNVDEIMRLSQGLTQRVYSMFRWAVTPKFLEVHNVG